MSRPLILLDCDGVLADFVGAVCRELELMQLPPKKPEDFTTWNLEETLGAEVFDRVSRAISARNWAKIIHPYEGSGNFVHQLRIIGHVVCVTAPWDSPTWMESRYKWLSKCFGFTRQDVFFTSRKGLLRGDYLIEDSLANVNAWEGDDGLGIILDRPWNQGKLAKPFVRAKSYEEILKEIRTIEGCK